MRQRLPLVLSSLALAIACLGFTGIGDAATSVVKKALFARNAGTVNGIKASKSAKAGRLFPLGKNKKFPASVLTITKGPKGDRGPAGPQGGKGDPGAKGDPGGQGAAGTARAYGWYDNVSGKVLDSKNIVGVAHGAFGAGDWCITLDPSIDASKAIAVGSTDYNDGGYTYRTVWSSEPSGCAAHPNSVQIWTLHFDSVTPADTSFDVVVP